MTSDAQFPFGQPIVWQPSEEYVRRSRLQRFMDRHGLSTLEELMARSTPDIAWFWEAVFEDLGIEFYEPYTQVVDLCRGIQWPRWCVGAKLNIVHNCLDKWMGTPTQNRVAIRWEGEEGTVRLLTYRDLYREVNRVAVGAAGRRAGQGRRHRPLHADGARDRHRLAGHRQDRRGHPAPLLRLWPGRRRHAPGRRRGQGAVHRRRACSGAARSMPMKPIADEALADVPIGARR